MIKAIFNSPAHLQVNTYRDSKKFNQFGELFLRIQKDLTPPAETVLVTTGWYQAPSLVSEIRALKASTMW
jgi:hypothetical protein